MTDYTKLVEALRYCAESGDFNCNKDCPMYPNYPRCLTKMDMDAAAAIEALEARLGEAENSVERWKDMYLTKHEPKRGEWIIDGAYTYNLRELNDKAYEPVYRCSCCNRQTESYLRLDEPKMPEDADFPEYCPHCGAKMEVQDGDK